MLSKSHQLDQLDDARRGFEVSDVESDLEGLGVGAGVRHHRHVGLHGGLGRVWARGGVGIHHAATITCSPLQKKNI